MGGGRGGDQLCFLISPARAGGAGLLVCRERRGTGWGTSPPRVGHVVCFLFVVCFCCFPHSESDSQAPMASCSGNSLRARRGESLCGVHHAGFSKIG